MSLIYKNYSSCTPFSISSFSCCAIACADTISASRFSRGVWSPIRTVSESESGNRMSISVGVSRTGWCVGLQSCDDSRLGNFIRTAVLHINRCQQEHVTLFSDARGNGLHDFAIDRLLVVCDEVLVQELLDLIRGEPGRR